MAQKFIDSPKFAKYQRQNLVIILRYSSTTLDFKIRLKSIFNWTNSKGSNSSICYLKFEQKKHWQSTFSVAFCIPLKELNPPTLNTIKPGHEINLLKTFSPFSLIMFSCYFITPQKLMQACQQTRHMKTSLISLCCLYC